MVALAVVSALLISSISCISAMTIDVPDVPFELAYPETDIDKHHIQTVPYLIWDGVQTPVSYNVILQSGQKANQSEKFGFGQQVNATGQAVYEIDQYGNPDIDFVPNTSRIIGNYSVSQNPDFASILQVGGRLFSFVHFESPGPFQAYFVELQQDTATCGLKAISQIPTDWSAWGGLWTPCAGSVSPWQTHLGSEEYEPNALLFSLAKNATDLYAMMKDDYTVLLVQSQLRYWGLYPNTTTLADINKFFKPYKYGHATEMTAYANGSYSVQKHYAMGRQAWELPYVMPDNMTVYGSDDGENTMLTMFKAAKPNDLSCGTLYGARFNQTSNSSGGAFTISWVDMGYGCDTDYVPFADNTTFMDIFEYAKYDVNATTPCPAGLTAVNTGSVLGAECLRIKPGMERLASRFETRRYLALMGGTTEFTKMEGITFSPNHGAYGRIYVSISRVENSMEDYGGKGKNSSAFDVGGPNHIRLPWNRCGCVMQLDVNMAYNATNMSALICGNTKNNTDSLNICDVNSISAPDNLSMMRGHNSLIIGEDTSDHQTDAVWLYNFETKGLKRVQTTPFGAETTSAYWYEDINSCAYWMSVVQHPYGESDIGRAADPGSSGKAGKIGFIGPLHTSKAMAPIRAPMTISTAG
jgi:hypothetical protein